MLFILSGDIQIGKTRWLEQLVSTLEQRGTTVCGVLSPGVWEACGEGNARDTGAGAGGAFEKLGIDNLLLPGHERIPFATRNDAALPPEGRTHARRWVPRSEEDLKRGLWQFDDRAIERVNEHFLQLAERTDIVGALLVVDEFGQMELCMDRGFTAAAALVERGASPAFSHAAIVVRDALASYAHARFGHAPWGGMCTIAPTEEAREHLLGLFPAQAR